MSRIFITKRIYPEAVEQLRARFEVDYSTNDDGLTTAEVVARSQGCSAVISQLTDRLPADALAQMKGVRIISNCAVGFDNIDVAAATALGICVTNTPGVLTDTTADFAFALLMAAARRVPEAGEFLRAGRWKSWLIDLLAGQDVWGATIGLFGVGRIGLGMARRAHGFNMRILYCDAQPLAPEIERELNATRVSKEELLSQSDFVSLHVPFTSETRHLIGAAELALMKPTAILINTARGPVVDQEALIDALERRQIWAAGLDVYENEPEVPERLQRLPNAVLAPHIASASVATRRRMSMMVAESVTAALTGQRPPNLLNPETWKD